jgi:RND family efflux transporter MFP subunit
MKMRSFVFCLVCALLAASCGTNHTVEDRPPPPPTADPRPAPQPQPASTPELPPQVAVGHPSKRSVADEEEYPGNTDAVASVEIRARVTGYLDKVHVQDGAEVRPGQVLFEIDARPYKADLERAEASLARLEAHLKRLEADKSRAQALISRGGISREEYDRIGGDYAETKAEIRVAQANRDGARITLDFTRIVAPVAGHITARYVTPGALVKADETHLATVVTPNPIYVYFHVDERAVLRLRRAVQDGRLKAEGWVGLPVAMGLADEKGLPRRGTVDAADVRMDPEKGTLRLRATVPNSDGFVLPGMTARVRLTIGEPFQALLVPEQAVINEKGQASLFVVNDKDRVERRSVELGPRQGDLRAVRDGIGTDDWVILEGVGDLRPGMTVRRNESEVSGSGAK